MMRCFVGCTCHRCKGRQVREARTYQDRGADKDEVPQEVLLAREWGVALFELAHVLVHEVRIEEDTQLWGRDEEACYRPPELGQKSEEELGCVDKVVSRHKSEMDTNRQEKCRGCGVSVAGESAQAPGVDTDEQQHKPCEGRQPPVDISNVFHDALLCLSLGRELECNLISTRKLFRSKGMFERAARVDAQKGTRTPETRLPMYEREKSRRKHQATMETWRRWCCRGLFEDGRGCVADRIWLWSGYVCVM